MSKTILDIIIPTVDNISMLSQCINSFSASILPGVRDGVKIWIVNNGKAPLSDYVPQGPNLEILNPGLNIGWEGGLKYALERSEAPIVLFSNDDVRLITGQKKMMWELLSRFNDPRVGGVGPSSNFVMGQQNIFADIVPELIEVPYLIGFFFLVRRSALDKVGGIDDTLPGGDDIDLSIRLRDAGYKLIVDRRQFVFHHGAVTGNRVHEGYWNSQSMQEKTNLAIIRKHGMMKFWKTMVMGWNTSSTYHVNNWGTSDVEGDVCRNNVRGNKVLELGCGGLKTVPNSIGVDIHKNGDRIPLVTHGNDRCVADLTADVSVSLPVPWRSQDTVIARHILEHCQDPIGTLSVWNMALRLEGRLIVAVPDNRITNTIFLNPEHVITFVPESLRNMAIFCGFKQVGLYEDINGVSFVSVFEKIAEPYAEIGIPSPTNHAIGAQREREVSGACSNG